ncbi:hypothetical protein DF186_20990, partial [Enterococcus hirae]
KSPNVEVEQAISQSVRNQGDDYIPRLFTYVQLVMGINKNGAMYATTGTAKKFWAVWKELRDREEDVKKLVNRPLNHQQKDRL